MPASLNVQGIEIRRNQRLSDLDRAYMVLNYPRVLPDADPVASRWTVEHALDFAGVTGVTKTNILAFWRARDYPRMRLALNAWNAAKWAALRSNNPDAKAITLDEMKEALKIYNDVLADTEAISSNAE
jgi:hypothetical protein